MAKSALQRGECTHAPGCARPDPRWLRMRLAGRLLRLKTSDSLTSEERFASMNEEPPLKCVPPFVRQFPTKLVMEKNRGTQSIHQ